MQLIWRRRSSEGFSYIAHSFVSRMPSVSQSRSLADMSMTGDMASCLLGFLRLMARPSSGSVTTMTGVAPKNSCKAVSAISCKLPHCSQMETPAGNARWTWQWIAVQTILRIALRW